MAATSSAVVLIILQAVPQTQALLLLCSLGCMGRSVQGFAHHDGLLRQQGVAHLFSDPGCKAASVQLAGGPSIDGPVRELLNQSHHLLVIRS